MASVTIPQLAGASPDSVRFEAAYVSGGNGNGLIDRHECNNYQVVLQNFSTETLRGLTASLSTTNLGVEITGPVSTYPDLPAGAMVTNDVPFQIGTASWFPSGTPIGLALTLTSTNAAPNIVTWQQSTPVNSVDGGGSCPSTLVFGGGILPTDEVQIGRLNRLTPAMHSTCAVPKVCPGPSAGADASLPRHYDAYTLVNRTEQTTCITAELSTSCSLGAQPMYSAAYLGRFDPANLCENYVGDIGESPRYIGMFYPYSFQVPAGATFTVVVNEVNADSGCGDYTLKITSEAGFEAYEPVLKISRQNAGTVVVTWSTNAFRFQLESAASAGSPFVDETNVPSTVGEDFTVTNASGEINRIYRLRKH